MSMWTRRLFCNLRSVFWLASALLAPCARGDGSYSALSLPYHARTLALGSAGIADARPPDAPLANPALLSGAARLSLSWIRYPGSISAGHTAWQQTWKNHPVAAMAGHVAYGSFDRRDEEGATAGSFAARDTWVSTAVATSVGKRLTLGVSGSLFSSVIEDVSSWLILGSAGAAVAVPEVDLVVGASVRNVGTAVDRYTEHREAIPSSFALGMSKRLKYLPLVLNLDALRWKGGRTALRLGGEFSLSHNLFFRWGISSDRADLGVGSLGRDLLAGASVGAGYRLGTVILDAGVKSLGPAGWVAGASAAVAR